MRHGNEHSDAVKLLGSLFDEWLASGDSGNRKHQVGGFGKGFDVVPVTPVSQALTYRMSEERKCSEKGIFFPVAFDEPSIHAQVPKTYLEDLSNPRNRS